jgi:hypothetical protein
MSRHLYGGIELWLHRHHPHWYQILDHALEDWETDDKDHREYTMVVEAALNKEILAVWKAYRRLTN